MNPNQIPTYFDHPLSLGLLTLDPFYSEDGALPKSGLTPDSSVIRHSDNDKIIDAIIEEYLEIEKQDFDYYMDQFAIEEIQEKYLLDPSQIDILFKTIFEIKQTDSRIENYTHDFMNAMINKSFKLGGYNNFRIETGNSLVHYIAASLKGLSDNMLNISIDGNLGACCGERSEYIAINIAGDALSELGEGAKHSKFNIYGKIGTDCAKYAEHCVFNLYASHIDTSHGVIPGFSAWNCEFNVCDHELYTTLTKRLMAGNTLHHIDSSNNILEELVFTKENTDLKEIQRLWIHE